MAHIDRTPFIQDWAPTVIRKSDSKKKTETKPVGGGSRIATLDGVHKSATEEDYEAPKLDKLTTEQRSELVRLRTAKGLTRKQLASNLSVTESEIAKLENPSETYNKGLYGRVKNYLLR
jgi:ribosome-binding protein aMBF1 (putative translation factor)